MSEPKQTDPIAAMLAEEILRKIFGDDLLGCPVTLQEVADIIQEAQIHTKFQGQELLGLHQKSNEALYFLSCPPPKESISDPSQLLTVLTERLDKINDLSGKLVELNNKLRPPTPPDS
jgi:hypothetical protein